MQLYFVKMLIDKTHEVFHKIGVTTHTDTGKRFKYGETKVTESGLELREIVDRIFSGQRYISDTPYKVEKIHVVSYNLEGDALIAERDLLNVLKQKQYWPREKFSGRSECFNGEGLEDFIINFMNTDSAERNKKAPSELMYRVNSIGIKKETDPIKRHLLILERCESKK